MYIFYIKRFYTCKTCSNNCIFLKLIHDKKNNTVINLKSLLALLGKTTVFCITQYITRHLGRFACGGGEKGRFNLRLGL